MRVAIRDGADVMRQLVDTVAHLGELLGSEIVNGRFTRVRFDYAFLPGTTPPVPGTPPRGGTNRESSLA